MQSPSQDITPPTLTRQIKTDDVKLKHMTSLIGLVLRYFARDVKLTAAANIKSEMRSFKSNENIHKKEGGSYYVVSANKDSSVTL